MGKFGGNGLREGPPKLRAQKDIGWVKTTVSNFFSESVNQTTTKVYKSTLPPSGVYSCAMPRNARYCYSKSSVRPSVCLSVTLMYRGRMCWVSSKLITRSSLLGVEPHADVVWSAAANRVYRFGGGGAPISFCWRRRRVLFTGGGGAARRVIVHGAKIQQVIKMTKLLQFSDVHLSLCLLSAYHWWRIRKDRRNQNSFQHMYHAVMSTKSLQLEMSRG